MKAATHSVLAHSVPVNQELLTVPSIAHPRKKRRSRLQMVCEDYTLGVLDGRPSTSMCFVVSTGLAGYLHFFEKLKCDLVEGMVGKDHHWWIGLEDGRIVDATADQFNGRGNPDMPMVYIGELPSWYAAQPAKNTEGEQGE